MENPEKLDWAIGYFRIAMTAYSKDGELIKYAGLREGTGGGAEYILDAGILNTRF